MGEYRARDWKEANEAGRAIAEIERRKFVLEESAKEQIAEITEWRDGELARLDGILEGKRAFLQPFVDEQIADEPGKRQSIKLANGQAGWRTPTVALIVEDEAEVVRFLKLRFPQLLTPHEPTLNKMALKALPRADDGSLRMKRQDGEIVPIPGVRMPDPTPSFYVDVSQSLIPSREQI